MAEKILSAGTDYGITNRHQQYPGMSDEEWHQKCSESIHPSRLVYHTKDYLLVVAGFLGFTREQFAERYKKMWDTPNVQFFKAIYYNDERPEAYYKIKNEIFDEYFNSLGNIEESTFTPPRVVYNDDPDYDNIPEETEDSIVIQERYDYESDRSYKVVITDFMGLSKSSFKRRFRFIADPLNFNKDFLPFIMIPDPENPTVYYYDKENNIAYDRSGNEIDSPYEGETKESTEPFEILYPEDGDFDTFINNLPLESHKNIIEIDYDNQCVYIRRDFLGLDKNEFIKQYGYKAKID